MSKNNYQTIIASIRKGGLAREKVLKQLFQAKEYNDIVRRVVLDGGGERKDGDMIYEDCMVLLDKEIRNQPHFVLESLEHYFEECAKSLWSLVLKRSEIRRQNILKLISLDTKLKQEVSIKITKNNGRLEDAEDCFQTGLLLLDTQLREGKYRGGSIKGYFYQICYNLWRNELKKSKSYSLEESMIQQESSDHPEKMLESKEYAEQLNSIFSQMGESCKKVLHLKYFVVDQFSMEEIAMRMGLKNAQNASNLLTKCRARLKELFVQLKQEI